MGHQKDIADELERVSDITPARRKLFRDAAIDIRRQRKLSSYYSGLIKQEVQKSRELEAKIKELEARLEDLSINIEEIDGNGSVTSSESK